MKSIIYIVCAGSIIGLFTFVGFIQFAQAETIIEHVAELQGDVEWSVQGSPYILADDVFVGQGASLTIHPGTEVKSFSTERRGGIVVSGGSLSVKGSREHKVSIDGLNGIGASDNGSISIEFAQMNDMVEAIQGDHAHIFIASSTISESEIGIKIRSSTLVVHDTEIEGNGEGIHIGPPGIFQARASGLEATGGIGNALEDVPLGASSVTVANSIVENNKDAAVISQDWTEAHMEGNWWGSPAGPGVSGGGSISGNVGFQPWLTKRPAYDELSSTCCSNILFIPGLQASRLFRTEIDARMTAHTNRLWEPNRNADVKKLFLNASGSSTISGIYAEGPIDAAFGIAGIYGSFMEYLDALQNRGTIRKWKSYGYDWRKPVAQVVAGSEQRATTTESLTTILEDLAASSNTGKVSIVAHSNGGLIAKYLVKKMAEAGKDGLVDTVISVGVPYLGTPQAILGLLHGDGQSIGGGALLKQSVARELGINMPSAYSLLPSKEYFKKALGPTIAFASTTIQDIDTYNQQKDFIVDAKNARRTTVGSKTTLPIEGNKLLVAAAEALHSILDPFSWPASIAHWAIVGWGNKTAKGVIYSDKTECRGPGLRPLCITSTLYEPISTLFGDGTVVMQSAAHDGGDVVSIDLPAQEEVDSMEIKHANILESSTVQEVIGDIITSTSGDVEKVDHIKDTLANLPGVSVGMPDQHDEEEFTVISTHSPVELHLYDAHGNHTGLIAPPAELEFEDGDEGLDEDLYTFYENKIPGTDFEIREGDIGNETYITLGKNAKGSYNVSIQGTGPGTFDYIVERIKGDEIMDRVEYLDIPVTSLTVATGTLQMFGQNESAVPLASSTDIKVNDGKDKKGWRSIRGKWGREMSCRHSRHLVCTTGKPRK